MHVRRQKGEMASTLKGQVLKTTVRQDLSHSRPPGPVCARIYSERKEVNLQPFHEYLSVFISYSYFD